MARRHFNLFLVAIVSLSPLLLIASCAHTASLGNGDQVSMSVTSFDFEHMMTSDFDMYFGKGTITVTGGPAANRPYLALVSVRKTAGGDTSGLGVAVYHTVLLVNGKGIFLTSDGGRSIDKPTYVSEVLGYIPFEQIPEVEFEVSSFELVHSQSMDSSFHFESYSGTAVVTAEGQSPAHERPYWVLVFYSPQGTDLGQYEWFLVQNGLGEFSTYVSSDDENEELDRPEYDFNIAGAIPLQVDDTAVGFSVLSFRQTFEPREGDSVLSVDRYTGAGLLKTNGSFEVDKHKYLVALEIRNGPERTYQTDPVVGGIGQFTTIETNDAESADFRKPNYEFRVIGFVQLVEN